MKYFGNKDQHDQNKEKDYIAPTEINNDPEQIVPDSAINPNPSHSELLLKLERHHMVDASLDQHFFIQALKNKYLNEIGKRTNSRALQDVNYAHGQRAGLPHKNFAFIEQARIESDQFLRNKIAEELKDRYRSSHNLAKEFNDNKQTVPQLRIVFDQNKGAINDVQKAEISDVPKDKLPESKDPNLNFTHYELKDKLDLYAAIGGKMDQFMVIQGLKNQYLKEMDSRGREKIQQNIYLEMAKGSGMSPSLGWVKEMWERFDQDLRNETVEDAKDYYHKNNSLAQEFIKAKPSATHLKAKFQEVQERQSVKDQSTNEFLKNLKESEQDLVKLKAEVERQMIQFGTNYGSSLTPTAPQTNEIQLQAEFERIRSQYKDFDKDRGVDMDK